MHDMSLQLASIAPMTSSDVIKKYALLIDQGLENQVFCDAANKGLTVDADLHRNCRLGTKVIQGSGL